MRIRNRDLLPSLAGVFLVVLFTSLGLWQLDRAEQKSSTRDAFENPGEYLPIAADGEYSLYQPLEASGRFLHDRQFLLDNAIQDGQIGYFVITPFELSAGEPLLLVNRGWIPRGQRTGIPAATGISDPASAGATVVRGRSGRLPRVGIRAGEPFEDEDWPRIANWPTLDELSAALGREVLPFVLLADPQPGSAFVRRWEPQESGPMRHIAYAFQWFALAIAIVVLAVVLYRKRRAER